MTITNRHGFIVEDGGNYVRVTLPDWLTPDQRQRFEGELDDIFQGSRGKRRRPEAVSTAIVAFVHDEAARQGIELSIPDPPTVDELAAAGRRARNAAVGHRPEGGGRARGLTLEARAYRASSSTSTAPPLEV